MGHARFKVPKGNYAFVSAITSKLAASLVRPVGTSMKLVFEASFKLTALYETFRLARGWAWSSPRWVLGTEFCWVNC